MSNQPLPAYPNVDRTPAADMRLPGESFCGDCPDREGCASGAPCDFVRAVNLGSRKPLHAHDCDWCTYLGPIAHIDADGGEADLWVHAFDGDGKAAKDGTFTYIVRLSSDGPDYLSGAVFVGHIDAITEADRRWRLRSGGQVPAAR